MLKVRKFGFFISLLLVCSPVAECEDKIEEYATELRLETVPFVDDRLIARIRYSIINSSGEVVWRTILRQEYERTPSIETGVDFIRVANGKLSIVVAHLAGRELKLWLHEQTDYVIAEGAEPSRFDAPPLPMEWEGSYTAIARFSKRYLALKRPYMMEKVRLQLLDKQNVLIRVDFAFSKYKPETQNAPLVYCFNTTNNTIFEVPANYWEFGASWFCNAVAGDSVAGL